MIKNTIKRVSIGLLGAMLLTTIGAPKAAFAAELPVKLGLADSFAILSGETITNTGPTTITGDVGIYAGSAITGLPDMIINGVVHESDPIAIEAKTDLAEAYTDAAGRTPQILITSELGGQVLTPGVYTSENGHFEINGTLTLDAGGDSSAVFIFQTATELTTFASSEVVLINSAKPCNVFWKVGSSAILGTNSKFVGTIMALTSISAATGAEIRGQLLAKTGSVTLQSNKINNGPCRTPGIDLEGRKVWVGGPEVKPVVSLQLLRDGFKLGVPVKMGVPVELVPGVSTYSAYTFKNLRPIDGNGKAYVYTVEEVATPALYDMTKEGMTVTNTYNAGSVEFTKHDEAHKALAGAVFGLYSLTDTAFATPIAEATSDALGKVSFDGVKMGTYNVREISAPAGYNVSDTVLKVTLDTAGDIVTSVPDMLVNTTIRGSVVVEKSDEDGNPLAGAEFTLYRAGVKVGEPKTTAAEGRVTFSGIAFGDYTVKETKAPVGYILDGTARNVSIVKDGVAEKISVTNNSITGEVTITKTDLATGKALAGAQFTIVDAAGAKAYIGTTPASGKLSVKLPFGKYIVSETAAPKNYEKTTQTYSVDITVDGQTFNLEVKNKARAAAADGTLPQTGGIPSEFFYIMGALAIAGGILMMRRKRKA